MSLRKISKIIFSIILISSCIIAGNTILTGCETYDSIDQIATP